MAAFSKRGSVLVFPYEGMLADTVMHPGYDGDEIVSYYARPLGPGPFPGVVVIHHMPGWDERCKEVARKFAYHGYAAILPNLFTRAGYGAPDDISAAVRSAGGVSDDQAMGDVEGALKFLGEQVYVGKVGVIGFC